MWVVNPSHAGPSCLGQACGCLGHSLPCKSPAANSVPAMPSALPVGPRVTRIPPQAPPGPTLTRLPELEWWWCHHPPQQTRQRVPIHLLTHTCRAQSQASSYIQASTTYIYTYTCTCTCSINSSCVLKRQDSNSNARVHNFLWGWPHTIWMYSYSVNHMTLYMWL